jgi:hypothetical protein
LKTTSCQINRRIRKEEGFDGSCNVGRAGFVTMIMMMAVVDVVRHLRADSRSGIGRLFGIRHPASHHVRVLFFSFFSSVWTKKGGLLYLVFRSIHRSVFFLYGDFSLVYGGRYPGFDGYD